MHDSPHSLRSLLRSLIQQSRGVKALILAGLDLLLLTLCLLLAFAVRFSPEELAAQIPHFQVGIYWWLGLHTLALWPVGLYRPILRHAGPEILGQIVRGVGLGSLCFLLLWTFQPQIVLPRSIGVMAPVFALITLISARLMLRWLIRVHLLVPAETHRQAVVIYGAGAAGLELWESLRHQRGLRVHAFVDDDVRLQGRHLRGLPIFSPHHLPGLQESLDLQWVFLALPRVSRQRRRQILEELRPLRVGIKVLPTMDQLLQGKGTFSALQEVQVEDLLGRDEIPPELSLLSKDVKNKCVLVTGAGGSIGSALSLEILRQQPRKLILLEQNEFTLYQLERQLQGISPATEVCACLGSVLEQERLLNLLQTHKVQTVYHAAAYKHVPLVETNPLQGLHNNALGTLALVEACAQQLPESFVLISTDKAVRPTNVMGATKRIAELLVQDAARRRPSCRWTMVRFGNVLDSSGSVIPLFREQLQQRKALTVTHPEITRYFMSIGEAVRLVMQAGAMAQGGEVYLLDMGQPVRILELARQMIELSGLVPERDIPIQFTGLRPGEKLYEELLIEPELAQPTQHPRIFHSREPLPPEEWLDLEISSLRQAVQANDVDAALASLRRLVPEYGPAEQSMLLQELPTPSASDNHLVN